MTLRDHVAALGHTIGAPRGATSLKVVGLYRDGEFVGTYTKHGLGRWIEQERARRRLPKMAVIDA